MLQASYSFVSTMSSLAMWSSKGVVEMMSRLSKYACTHSKLLNSPFIFAWKMSGALATPIGSRLYMYSPHRNILCTAFDRLLDPLLWCNNLYVRDLGKRIRLPDHPFVKLSKIDDKIYSSVRFGNN